MEIRNNINTNFVNFFGKNTRMKLLDFLIENDRRSWKKTEIMYNAKVGHTCLLVVLNDLIELKIIKLEKNEYSLNKKNRFTKLIIQIWNEINNMAIRQELKNGKK